MEADKKKAVAWSETALAKRIGEAFAKMSPEARAAARAYDALGTWVLTHHIEKCDEFMECVDLQPQVDDPGFVDPWLAGFADGLEFAAIE
jgi:hypothetical protein